MSLTSVLVIALAFFAGIVGGLATATMIVLGFAYRSALETTHAIKRTGDYMDSSLRALGRPTRQERDR